MAAELSKLHVRYIQTQTTFSMLEDEEQKGESFPLKQLYIKDKGHFTLSI